MREAGNMSASDQELIIRTLDGRLEAYDELMERYQRLVYKLAFGYAKSHEGALDLTQNVFLKVYRKVGSFRGKSQFKTWLIRIVCNEGVSWIRANRRHLEGRESLEQLETVFEEGTDQLEQQVQREYRDRLLGGLARLGGRYKTALELRYFHDLSIREVALALDCSEGTAKNTLFRGVRRLREQVVEG
jgi:RNA polymerase sigma-70 factor (ECF subfamily)